ncbi:MAG: hypothetical protein EAX95_06880 [Candidatus Thorarchaeota archaeon]|nr:hypothetical protein [Candidatus Thorarchaeota archaeon]
MKSNYLAVSLVLTVLLLGAVPLDAGAAEISAEPISITRISYPSVVRNWSHLELIYQDMWHDPAMLQEEIDMIHDAASAIVDLETLGQTVQGRDIVSLKITNELSPVQKAKTVVVAHHHGREQITVEAALRFILRLVNGYGEDQQITDYLDSEEIYIIPSLNLDALERVVNLADYWLRKNLQPYNNDHDDETDEDPANDVDLDGQISEFDVFEVGTNLFVDYYFEGIDDDGDGKINEDEIGLVDLNRNYATYWGMPGSSDDPTAQTYHGAFAFSEPETAAFRDFALQHKFAMAYSLHSGTNATYLPSNEDNYYPLPELYSTVLDDFVDILPPYFFGSGYYPSPETHARASRLEAGTGGLWKEWMYYSRSTPLPVCFEIYHNPDVDLPSASVRVYENETHYIEKWTGIYGYFAPELPLIQPLWEEISPAFDYLLEMLPRLDVTIPEGTQSGTALSLNMTMTNLSPRLYTKDNIQILGPDGGYLYSFGVVQASSTYDGTVEFQIPPTLLGTNFTIRVGNDYSGFSQFEVQSIGVPQTQFELPSELILTVGIGVVVLVALVVYASRRR